MEMISIPKESYEEFLRWRGGAINTPKPAKTPEGGWKFYRPGENPFDPRTHHSGAQNELCQHDLKTAIELAERAGSPLVPTLREMAKKDLLSRNGY